MSGSREEYNFTREDGAMLECWSTPITDIHTLESYLQDRGNESRNEPVQVSIDGRSGWLIRTARRRRRCSGKRPIT